MAVWEGKSYKMVSIENLDEFLVAVNADEKIRKSASAIFPVVKLKKDGDWLVLTTFIKENRDIKFKLGEEFDEERYNGVKVKSTITMDGNKMTHVQKDADGKLFTIVREFGPEEMKSVMTVGSVICTATFKAQ